MYKIGLFAPCSNTVLLHVGTFQSRRNYSRPIPQLSLTADIYIPAREESWNEYTLLNQVYALLECVQVAFKDFLIHKDCASQYISHFAAFFIDARAKRSIVESFSDYRLLINQQ